MTAILRKSRATNAKEGLTGALCLCNSGRLFIQVLEGGRNAVSRATTASWPTRATPTSTLLQFEEIDERRFAGWSMGQVNMARLNPGLILKYSELGTRPGRCPGEATAALFDEMIATAAIMGQP